MENTDLRTKVEGQIRQCVDHTIILDRHFLEDEQLLRTEQLAVLEEIFNANVRDAEIKEMASHFAGLFRGDHPMHLSLWGKTGTGKTLTATFIINLISRMCREQNILLRFVHLDIATPRPCFRALNDLACLLNACRRYKKGLSLEELMGRIEDALSDYRGYLVLFVDEVDNVRRDRDTFLTFLIRRLPQAIPSKLILVFASNKFSWSEQMDPRIKSFLKVNELVFKPYDAMDLQKILHIRVQKALKPGAVSEGVIEKIAALASREHGDARKAVGLLAQSAYLAEKQGLTITLDLVDQAAAEIEKDKYLLMIRTAPVQMQAAMAGVIQALGQSRKDHVDTGEAYDAYRAFCQRAGLRSISGRAFGDMIGELDLYSLLRARVSSQGRYGRTRRIACELPPDIIDRMYETIVLNFELGVPPEPLSHSNREVNGDG
jgi:cell division control protein 6